MQCPIWDREENDKVVSYVCIPGLSNLWFLGSPYCFTLSCHQQNKKNDCTPVGIGSVDRKSLYNKIEVQWKGDVVGMGEVPI